MTGVAVEFEVEGLVDVGRVLGRLSQLDLVELQDVAGGLLVSSAQRRIQEEKTSPEGVAWPAWSPAYAATRIPGVHSLLVGGHRPAGEGVRSEGGHLQGSIEHHFAGDVVLIGSNLPYAAVHQFGSDDGGNIPARPYLGISADDRAAIEAMALDLFGEAVA